MIYFLNSTCHIYVSIYLNVMEGATEIFRHRFLFLTMTNTQFFTFVFLPHLPFDEYGKVYKSFIVVCKYSNIQYIESILFVKIKNIMLIIACCLFFIVMLQERGFGEAHVLRKWHGIYTYYSNEIIGDEPCPPVIVDVNSYSHDLIEILRTYFFLTFPSKHE